MKKLRECLAKEAVNTGRQPELDIGKAVPVFFLAFVHCIIECTAPEALDHGIPFLFDYVIGSPISAPMFMFAMGIGICYSRKQGAKELAKRALRMYLIGLLLNVCRFLIPYLTGYLISGDTEQYIEPLVYRMLGNDILEFAALSLFCIAVFQRFRLPDWAMLMIAFVCSLGGWALNDIDLGNPVLNVALGHFIGTEDAAGLVVSDFPLLNWLLIPTAGYVFGKVLRRVKDKDHFYPKFAPFLLAAAVIFLVVEWYFGFGMNRDGGENTYYHATTYDILAFISLTVGLLGFYHFIQRFLPKKLMDFFTLLSRSVTSVYCIHWVFVVWITNVLLYLVRGTQLLPVGLTMLLSAGIALVSIILAACWQKIKSKRLSS